MDGGSQWRPLGPHLINKEIFPGYNIGYNCRKIMGSLDQWDGNICSDVSSHHLNTELALPQSPL